MCFLGSCSCPKAKNHEVNKFIGFFGQSFPVRGWGGGNLKTCVLHRVFFGGLLVPEGTQKQVYKTRFFLGWSFPVRGWVGGGTGNMCLTRLSFFPVRARKGKILGLTNLGFLLPAPGFGLDVSGSGPHCSCRGRLCAAHQNHLQCAAGGAGPQVPQRFAEFTVEGFVGFRDYFVVRVLEMEGVAWCSAQGIKDYVT